MGTLSTAFLIGAIVFAVLRTRHLEAAKRHQVVIEEEEEPRLIAKSVDVVDYSPVGHAHLRRARLYRLFFFGCGLAAVYVSMRGW